MPVYAKRKTNTRAVSAKPAYKPRAVVKRARATPEPVIIEAPSKTRIAAGRVGSGMGRSIGTGLYDIGSHFANLVRGKIQTMIGSGDYQVGDMPRQNSLTGRSSEQIPKFLSTKNSLMITHREYLGDVFSSPIGSTPGSFHIQSFRVNPGLSQSFPWLSSVANSFEQYKLLGLVYEYKSTSSDFNATGQTLGTVIMATEYDVMDVTSTGQPFTSKQQMEASEYAVSCKSSMNMMHGVECARGQSILGERYVRAAGQSIGGDPRFYDACTVAIATQGVSAVGVNLGELWVTYNMAFLKPAVQSQLATAFCARLQLLPANVAMATPVPLTGATVHFDNIGLYHPAGGNGHVIAAHATAMPVGTVFEIIVNYVGGIVSAIAPSISGSQGLELINCYAGAGAPQLNSPYPAAVSAVVTVQSTFRYVGFPASGGAGWSINFTTSGWLAPGSLTSVDFRINQLNSNAY